MPRTILPRRNRRCALSATGTWKPEEEEKDTRGVTYFMEENVISPREVVRFNEHIRNWYLNCVLMQNGGARRVMVFGGARGVMVFGGARGVMVIIVGNEHGDTSSNPGRDWLHFT